MKRRASKDWILFYPRDLLINQQRGLEISQNLNEEYRSTVTSSSETPSTNSRARSKDDGSLMPNNHLLSLNYNSFRTKSKSSSFHSRYTLISFIIATIFLSKQSCNALTDFHHKECILDKDFRHEVIQPLVVVENSLITSLPKNNISSATLPLTANVDCPKNLKIQFSGYGDTFVISLVKNMRLISDRYFEISKDNTNRHGRHPDASSKDSSHLDDGEFYKNHLFLNLHNYTSNNEHCHYHGLVNGDPSSIAAISIMNHKLLSGFFHVKNNVYYLYANTTSLSTILTKSTDFCNSKQVNLDKMTELKSMRNSSVSSNFSSTGDHHKQQQSTSSLIRSRRSPGNQRRSLSTPTSSDNVVRQQPFQSNSTSLYVELLVVHDHSQYTEYKGNTSNIAERTLQIVNIMNAFYRQLNIFVALVGVVLWTEKDEIQLTEDGDSTLTNFLKYRYEKLLPKYHHDNAQLITSTSFNGSVVGKALKGPICTHEHSGGVNTDHSHSPAIVAVTLAHELGHNFGMEHDEDDKCKCPDEKCIMSSSSSTVHPKHWSSCSIEYLEEAKKHGLLDCLSNQPKRVFGPICGNGFVEDGEDCDLGEPMPTYGTSKSRKSATTTKCLPGTAGCDAPIANPCCDRQTCKFVANATCAQGPCCDLSTCSVYKFDASEPKVCRQQKSECDLEEVCDGQSEQCPQDVHYHDGIECGPTASMDGRQFEIGSSAYNRTRAYCHNGKCSSHLSQCQLLWGSSGSVSKDICYEQNVHGNTSGNCGFDRREKVYEKCEEEDAVCGMLHCVHNQPTSLGGESRKTTGKLGYGFESASILSVSFFVMSNQAKIYCHGAIIDAGPTSKDPGLVPDGAACGEEKMCLNQKCVPVYEVVYKNWCPSDCNGNGICDNMGVCHCNDGSIGSSCYQFFGSNFHLSLLLYTIMFFVPMIALIVFTINHYRKQIKIWWFLHNRKIALKGREPIQRRLPADSNRQNISISEPIPLNQQNNINRPFYEPAPLDPWTETSCAANTTNKPLGFRLEPIKRDSVSGMLEPTAQSSATSGNLKPVRAAPPPPVPVNVPMIRK